MFEFASLACQNIETGSAQPLLRTGGNNEGAESDLHSSANRGVITIPIPEFSRLFFLRKTLSSIVFRYVFILLYHLRIVF